MRVHETEGIGAMMFLDENPIIIQCSNCEEEMEDTILGAPLVCPSCKKELFYRPWYSW